MTVPYLFNSHGLAAFAHYVTLETLFAFDLDGTLAPIVEDYSAAQISEPLRTTMRRLVNLAHVAVITGRSRKDAMCILGFEPHLLVGNHGSEWPDYDASRNDRHITLCQKWCNQLKLLLSDVHGVEYEFKGESVTLHYRKADDQENTVIRITTAIRTLEPVPKIIGGKYVVNLLPREAVTKGDALVRALNTFTLERSIYFGDDVTDENVFRMSDVDVLGIHVGKNAQTAADYYLKSQSELLGLLNSMVGILESLRIAVKKEES
ncbi:MAG: trehalose-phosphatase [Desulfuromonadaceae bacterium]|nr:trehalose-phosphatase [Desulfuromonadaceae bacterium]